MGILDWLNSFMEFFSLVGKQPKDLILGLNNAGKSTLLLRLAHCSRERLQHEPTTHPTSEELVIQNLRFVTIDYEGHRQDRPLSSDHLRDVAGIVFLVDVADHKRFIEAKAELHALLSMEEIQAIPIVVLGNKIDCLRAVSEEELRYEIGWERICGRAIELFMCSLALKLGYGEAFRWLAHHI